jgi:hypothetical protein
LRPGISPLEEENSRRASAVARHIRQDDEHVHAFLEGEILGHGQRAARGEMRSMIGSFARFRNMTTRWSIRLLEGTAEILGHVVLDAHRGEDDGEFRAFVLGYAGLPDYLDGELVVRHAGAGEYRQLLAADQRHQASMEEMPVRI